MSKRNIVNNLDSSFSLEYYVEDSQGNPKLGKTISINAGESQNLDEIIDTCWLKFIVHKNDGCTVTLSGNQILELITVKPVNSGGSDTETVIKISAQKSGDSEESNGDDDDVILDPPEKAP